MNATRACVAFWLGLTSVAAAQDARPHDLDAALADLVRAEPGYALLVDGPIRDAEARQVFEAILEEDPESVAATVGLMRMAERHERISKTTSPLRDWLTAGMEAGSVPALIALLDNAIYASEKDSSRPEELLERLQAIQPGCVWTLFCHARLASRRKKSADMELLLAPLLRARPGSLMFWEWLTDTDENAIALGRALQHLDDSPLSPGLHLRLANKIKAPRQRWDRLIELEQRFVGSPYWDDLRMTRVRLLNSMQVREQVELLEGVVEHGPSGSYASAAGQLASYYLLGGRAREAYDHLQWAGDLALGTEHHQCLMALEDYVGAEANALRMLRKAEKDARQPGGSTTAPWYRGMGRLCLAEALTAQGRHAEALDVYFVDLGAIDPPRIGPFTHSLASEHPVAFLGGILFPITWALASPVAAFVVFRHVRRIRPFATPALLIAVVMAWGQLIITYRIQKPPGALEWFGILAGLGATLMLVGAGSYLLRLGGVHMGPTLVRRRLAKGKVALGIALSIALMVAVTALLYVFQPPQINPFFERVRAFFPEGKLSVLLNPREDRLLASTLVVLAAISEELLFRGLLLGLFVTALRRLFGRRRKLLAAVIAVALTSLLWAFPHGGVVDPEWWKMTQVTLLGFVLGALCLRAGLLPAILAHALFNLAAVWVQ